MAMLGINYVSPFQVKGMVEAAAWGGRDFVIVDLRDADFAGGHIPGCEHIPSKTFIPTLDGIISRLQGKRMVIFHCLISMHRAPTCAKLYKERLMAMGRSQDVAVVEGGFHSWREQFSGNPRLIEGETLSQADAQRQYMQGYSLGQQFVADVKGSMTQGPNSFVNQPQSFPLLSQSTLNAQPQSFPSLSQSTLGAHSFSSPLSTSLSPQALYPETISQSSPLSTSLSPQALYPEIISKSSFPRYDVPTLPAVSSFKSDFQSDYGNFWAGGDVVRPLSSDRISCNPLMGA
jgi:Cdc25 family phosphatase